MAALSVGVIGIGAFGSRVALRLLWNGFHTLQLYDVNDISTRQFTNDYGGMLTGSPKMMAQTCDAVITVLPSAAELREVCFGWENLAKGFSNGGIVINLGIVDALEIVAIGRDLKERGVTLIDAPAFGTPAQASSRSSSVARRRHSRACAPCSRRWRRASSASARSAHRRRSVPLSIMSTAQRCWRHARRCG
jgi:3-hydroxyisobutyrate dehydrogenase-like beta-hydroxyacid dehydrogenase